MRFSRLWYKHAIVLLKNETCVPLRLKIDASRCQEVKSGEPSYQRSPVLQTTKGWPKTNSKLYFLS